MRTTVTVDDDLFNRAMQLCEPGTDKSEVFREAMRTFVRVQSAKRLASMGGKAPEMKAISRRNTV